MTGRGAGPSSEERVSKELVLQAARRLEGVVPQTPLQRSDRLSRRFGREVFLKREDLQPVRSYKLRGAYNHVAMLVESGAPPSSVVAASAGNHAQGVAWCCARLSIPGTVVLPSLTPRQKRERIEAIGGGWVEIVVAGSVFDEAAAYAERLAFDSGAALVPPFDSLPVLAGQGTVGLEILAQTGPGTVVAPVGGGGLSAGLALALAGSGCSLVAVEPSGAASLTAALRHGAPVEIPDLDRFVDGAAVKRVGAAPFAVLCSYPPSTVLTVDEGAVATQMLELYQSEGLVVEPAGALSVAALEQVPGSGPVVCVVSGGNNDVSRYPEVIERSLVHRGLKHYFLVEFDQTPGALRRFLDEVLGPDDDITLFEYTKKSNKETGPALVGVELASSDDLAGLLLRLDNSPLRYERLEPGSPLQRFLV